MNRTIVLVANDIFNRGNMNIVVQPVYDSYTIKVSLDRTVQKFFEYKNRQREKDVRNGYWRYQ